MVSEKVLASFSKVLAPVQSPQMSHTPIEFESKSGHVR